MKILLAEQTIYFLQVLEIAVLVAVSCGRGSFTRICLAIELGFGNLSFEFDFLGTASKHLRPTRFWLAFRILAAFGTQEPEKEEGKKKGVKAADDDDGQMWCLSGITNICLLQQPNKPKKLCSNGFSSSPGVGGCDWDTESFLQEQEIPNLTHDAFSLQI